MTTTLKNDDHYDAEEHEWLWLSRRLEPSFGLGHQHEPETVWSPTSLPVRRDFDVSFRSGLPRGMLRQNQPDLRKTEEPTTATCF